MVHMPRENGPIRLQQREGHLAHVERFAERRRESYARLPVAGPEHQQIYLRMGVAARFIAPRGFTSSSNRPSAGSPSSPTSASDSPPPPALIIASLIIPTIRTHTKSIKLKIKREGIMITRMRATVAMSDAAASATTTTLPTPVQDRPRLDEVIAPMNTLR